MKKIFRINWKYVLISIFLALTITILFILLLYLLSRQMPVMVTIICILLIFGKDKMDHGKKATIEIAILLVIITFLISTIYSIEPHRSWVWMVEISKYLMVLLISRLIIRRWVTVKQLSLILLLSGIAYQFCLTIDIANWFFQWHVLFPEFTFPPTPFRFDNGNGKAIILLMIFFLQAGLLYTCKNKKFHLLLIGGLFWTLGLFYFCSSRGGTLALGIAGLAFIGTEFKNIRQSLQNQYNKYFTNSWLIVLVLIILVPGLIIGGIELFNAINSHPSHGALDLGNRIPYWRPAWNSFLESPLLGNGFLTQTFSFLAENSIPPDGFYFNSHNLYLDILSGSGLMGIIAAGFLFVSIAAGLLQAKKNTPAEDQMLAVVAIPILIGFVVHSFFASSYLSYFVSIPLGIVIGAVLANDSRTIKYLIPVREILVGVVLISTWGLYFMNQPYLQAINGADENTWKDTSISLDIAVSRFPNSPLFNREAGYAHAYTAAQGDSEALLIAIERFRTAASLDPYYAPNYLNLGALQLAAGELHAARYSFEKAVSISSRWDLAWLNLGYCCELSDDQDCSRKAYMTALKLNNVWVTDPFWEDNSFRQTVVMATKASDLNEIPSASDLRMTLKDGYAKQAIDLAKKKISDGELEEAERLVKISPLLYMKKESDLVEIRWLEAELAATSGNKKMAAELGNEARNEFIEYKFIDSISAGINKYGEMIYLQPTLEIDLVPQVIWMQYPGDWKYRMEKLQEWEEK